MYPGATRIAWPPSPDPDGTLEEYRPITGYSGDQDPAGTVVHVWLGPIAAVGATCTETIWVIGHRDRMTRPTPVEFRTVTRKSGPVRISVFRIDRGGKFR